MALHSAAAGGASTNRNAAADQGSTGPSQPSTASDRSQRSAISPAPCMSTTNAAQTSHSAPVSASSRPTKNAKLETGRDSRASSGTKKQMA